MEPLRSDLPDPTRSMLRMAVAKVTGDLSSLSQRSTPEELKVNIGRVMDSWNELVNLLALGPEPEYRECPVCKHIAMRKATLCVYCFSKLEPLGPLAPGEDQTSLITAK